MIAVDACLPLWALGYLVWCYCCRWVEARPGDPPHLTLGPSKTSGPGKGGGGSAPGGGGPGGCGRGSGRGAGGRGAGSAKRLKT